jgi:hypothetical protein
VSAYQAVRGECKPSSQERGGEGGVSVDQVARAID